MEKIDPGIRHEDIERLAYELWQSRGSPVGSPQEDWEHATDIMVMREAAGRSAGEWNVPWTYRSVVLELPH